MAYSFMDKDMLRELMTKAWIWCSVILVTLQEETFKELREDTKSNNLVGAKFKEAVIWGKIRRTKVGNIRGKEKKERPNYDI